MLFQSMCGSRVVAAVKKTPKSQWLNIIEIEFLLT